MVLKNIIVQGNIFQPEDVNAKLTQPRRGWHINSSNLHVHFDIISMSNSRAQFGAQCGSASRKCANIVNPAASVTKIRILSFGFCGESTFGLEIKVKCE